MNEPQTSSFVAWPLSYTHVKTRQQDREDGQGEMASNPPSLITGGSIPQEQDTQEAAHQAIIPSQGVLSTCKRSCVSVYDEGQVSKIYLDQSMKHLRQDPLTFHPTVSSLSKVSRCYPHGLSVWRETSLGKCLISCLEDLFYHFGWSSCMIEKILECFDRVMNQQMCYTKPLGHFKILSGSIDKYKNLDGIWDMYISNFTVKDRRRCFMSDFIRIVAIETHTLNRLSANE